jgi:hypothetical protein
MTLLQRLCVIGISAILIVMGGGGGIIFMVSSNMCGSFGNATSFNCLLTRKNGLHGDTKNKLLKCYQNDFLFQECHGSDCFTGNCGCFRNGTTVNSPLTRTKSYCTVSQQLNS